MNPVDVLVVEIRRAVLKSGRAQVAICNELGISQKHLSEFMNGRSEPSLPVLRRLCSVLGMEW